MRSWIDEFVAMSPSDRIEMIAKDGTTLSAALLEAVELRADLARVTRERDEARLALDMSERPPFTRRRLEVERDKLRAELDRVTKELDEAISALKESADLDDNLRYGLAWIESVKEASVCAFCAPSNPETQEKAQEHMRTCEKHPLGIARARVEKLEAALRSLLAITVPVKSASPSWAISEIDMIVRRALEGK